MSEQPPKNPENNTGNAPLDEREVIVPATEEEIEARANEAVFIDSEIADARAESLGDARDAVMAQFEGGTEEVETSDTHQFMQYGEANLKVLRTETTGGRQWAVLEDSNVGGGERWMMLPEVRPVAPETEPVASLEASRNTAQEQHGPTEIEPVVTEKPNIVLRDVIPQIETNSAVIAAEEHLREVQATKSPAKQSASEVVQETEEAEPGPGVIERVHDRVEHARTIVGNVEKKITSTLGEAEHILRRVEGYLDEFQGKNRVQAKMLGMDDKVKEIRFLVNKTANIIGETHGAISAGARALDTPLRMLETLTDRGGEDVETQNVARENAHELQELKNTSPTSLGHEDLRGIDRNIRDLQGARLSQEEKLKLVRGTLRMIRAYNETRRDAERPDSPKKSQLQHIAHGLEVYLSVRR